MKFSKDFKTITGRGITNKIVDIKLKSTTPLKYLHLRDTPSVVNNSPELIPEFEFDIFSVDDKNCYYKAEVPESKISKKLLSQLIKHFKVQYDAGETRAGSMNPFTPDLLIDPVEKFKSSSKVVKKATELGEKTIASQTRPQKDFEH